MKHYFGLLLRDVTSITAQNPGLENLRLQHSWSTCSSKKENRWTGNVRTA